MAKLIKTYQKYINDAKEDISNMTIDEQYKLLNRKINSYKSKHEEIINFRVNKNITNHSNFIYFTIDLIIDFSNKQERELILNRLVNYLNRFNYFINYTLYNGNNSFTLALQIPQSYIDDLYLKAEDDLAELIDDDIIDSVKYVTGHKQHPHLMIGYNRGNFDSNIIINFLNRKGYDVINCDVAPVLSSATKRIGILLVAIKEKSENE